MYVNGFQVDENYILKENDFCTIREFPRDLKASTDLSRGLETLFGILTLGGWTAFSAIYTGVNGVNIFDKVFRDMAEEALKNSLESSETNKNKGDVQTIPSLLGAKNQNGYNSPYPLVLGKHLFTPRYIGMPYTTISGDDGESQWYHVLFLLGYNDLLVQNIKLGTLDLASNKGENPIMNGEIPVDSVLFLDEYNKGEIKIELQQGENEISFYDEKVVQEDLQLELTCVKLEDESLQYCPLTRFSAKNPRVVELEFTFPSLIGYDSKNNPQPAEVDLKVEYSDDAGNTWYEFGRIEGCQSYKNRTSHFSMQKSKKMRFIARKEFTPAEAFSQANLDNGRTYELRITRTSPNSIDNNVADRVYLTSIRTWCYDFTKSYTEMYEHATEEERATMSLVPQRPMIEADRNRTARLGLKIKASDKFADTLDSVNMILTSFARTWNGTEWSTEESPTNNPASLFLKVLQSSSRGNKKYPDSKIDLEGLGEFYEFCNEPMSELDSTPRYCCNTVIYNEIKTNDIINKVLQTGRASISRKGKKYGVVIDKPLEVPLAILNNQNILSFSAKKSFDELPSGLRIEFVNEHNGYETDEAVVLYEGKSLDDTDLVLKKVKLDYITNPKQAVREGYYELAKLKLRPEVWSLSVTTEGNLFEVGSLVEIQTDTILVGVGDGAEVTDLIIEDNYLTGIKTDGTFEVKDSSKEYGVKIYIANGVDEPKVLKAQVRTPAEGTYRDLYFTQPIFIDNTEIIPTIGDIVSFGEYDKITTYAICTGKNENEEGKFSCTFIPYDERVYTAEKGDIPEFDSKTTTIYSSNVSTIEPPTASKSELMEAISKIENGAGTEPPERPINVTAIAERDRIRLSCSAGGDGLNNSIKEFVWQYKKNAEDSWHDLTTDHYYFNHKDNVDAYYEREDFNSWYFRVKAVNNYGISSIAWTNVLVDTSSYGTWKLSKTVVDTPKNLDRTIILSMSQSASNSIREQYGVVKYQIEVSRFDDIDEEGKRLFFKPAMNKDPYASEDNYKDGEGFVLSSENFVQIVPLKGQSNYQIENTIYHYKITAISTDVETGKIVDTAEPVTKQTIALCTNIRDIVNASEEAKDEIEVRRLSAISAVLGEVRDGSLSGNENNYWTLSTKDHPQIQGDNSDFIGAFRVGGREQFLKVIPKNIVNGVPQNYEIKFKVGNFEVNTTETQLNNTIYLYDENDYTTHGKEGIEPYHTKRLVLSYQGITIQKNSDDATSDENGIWSDVGRITVDEKSNLYITNTNIEDKDFPKIKTFINGIIYHFDTNFLTEKSQSEEETIISGNLTKDDSTPIKEVSLNVLNGTISRTFEKDEEMFCLIKNARLSLGGDIIPESGYTLTDYKNVKKIPARFFVYKE